MPKFMLILTNAPYCYRGLSPAELEKKFQGYRAWSERLRVSGRYVGGEKLGEEGGKRLSLQNGWVNVVDGPYSEAKEIVGGFMIFRAANYEEAVEIARDCPFLHDGNIELRQTDPLGCGGE